MPTLNYQNRADAAAERPNWIQAVLGAGPEGAARALARELGGTYGYDRGTGRYPVTVPVGRWTAAIEFIATSGGTLRGRFTRVRVPFAGPPGWSVLARPGTTVDAVLESLCFWDVQVGDAAFDRAFVLRGSDRSLVRRLFADERVRGGLTALSDVTVQVDGVGAHRHLSLSLPGRVTDVRRLRQQLDAAAAVLGRLGTMGVATSAASA